MTHTANFLAADLEASSGRLMVGQWNGRTIALDELHRFPNGGVRAAGRLHWDVLRIWSEIQNGLMKYRTHFGNVPSAIGVDAWGVDFASNAPHTIRIGMRCGMMLRCGSAGCNLQLSNEWNNGRIDVKVFTSDSGKPATGRGE
jgi:hypothetical protein